MRQVWGLKKNHLVNGAGGRLGLGIKKLAPNPT